MKTKTAVILAAGIGKRLDAFETPKPLVKIGGKSLIIRTIETLKNKGIKKFFIVIRKNDNLIKRELIDYPADISFVEQKYFSRGVLGSLMSVENIVRGPFFVTMCDLIFGKNPYFLFPNKFKKDGISILISPDKKNNLLSGAQTKVLYKDKNIFNIGNDIKNYNALEAGIYHFTPDSYKDFAKIAKKEKDLRAIYQVFNKYNGKNNLISIILEKTAWFDINIPVTLIRAEMFLKKEALRRKQKEFSGAKYKKLKKDVGLDHNKRITFDVYIKRGLINKIDEHEIIPHKFYYSPHHIIIDKNIDGLYGDKIHKKLSGLGYKLNKILVDPGEKSKSIENFIKFANEIIDSGIDKKSIIISVGGGVVKDLAGFLASTLYRGIGFISIPTTLLSQCDAAIAFKQGVNGEKGKNLIGSYYAPMKIIVDPETLLTLKEEYISDGLAECLKQAFAQDKKFFNFFDKYEGRIKNIDFLEETVRESVKLKVRSIQDDFNEENVALVNQYGHEVGHALEYLSAYKLKHGEAVAIGMRVSAELSRLLDIANDEVVNSHRRLLKKFNLPISMPEDIRPEDIIHTLRYNKKFHSGEPRFVLVDKIGSIWNNKRFYAVACNDNLLKEAITRSYDN